MNIFIVCSKHFYHLIPPLQEELESYGHAVTLPNSYDEPFKEEKVKLEGSEAHVQWKSAMIRKQEEKVASNDAILALNFDKNGQNNYIGGATFLEIFRAWDKGKKIFLYNPIPENIFKDELTAMSPRVIHGDLSQIL